MTDANYNSNSKLVDNIQLQVLSDRTSIKSPRPIVNRSKSIKEFQKGESFESHAPDDESEFTETL